MTSENNYHEPEQLISLRITKANIESLLYSPHEGHDIQAFREVLDDAIRELKIAHELILKLCSQNQEMKNKLNE